MVIIYNKLGSLGRKLMMAITKNKLNTISDTLTNLALKISKPNIGIKKKGCIWVNLEYNGKKYEIPLITTKKIAIRWSQVEDENNNDVTDIIRMKAGPYKEFFGMPVKPGHLINGCKSLTFHFKNNKSITFGSRDIISF